MVGVDFVFEVEIVDLFGYVLEEFLFGLVWDVDDVCCE